MRSSADWCPAQLTELRSSVIAFLVNPESKIFCPIDRGEIKIAPSYGNDRHREVNISCTKCFQSAYLGDL